MVRSITLSTVVPLAAIPGQESALADVLASLQPRAVAEEGTYQWYATRITSADYTSNFIVFDTFPTNEAREAHFKGDIPKTLIGYGGTLLAGRPEHSKILTEVVGAKVGRVEGGEGDVKAGLKVGLKATLHAKEGKEDEVRKFLTDAVSLSSSEQDTVSFYAVHWPGTQKFGIIDFFASEEGKRAHLGGEIAKRLMNDKFVDEVLEGPPEVLELEVLGAKVEV